MRNTLVLAFALGNFFFTLRLFFAYVPIYYESLGFKPLWIGILMGVFPLSSLFLSLPLGRLTDRYTERGLAIFGLLLFWSFLLLFGYKRNPWAILFIVAVGSVGATLFRISCFSLFYKSAPFGKEGKRLGIINAGLLAGFGAGPFVGGHLLKYIGFDLFFRVVPLFLIPSIILSFLLKERKTYSKEDLGMKALMLKKEVMALLFLVFIFSSHIGVENVWLSIFLKDDIHLEEERIGMVYLVVGIALGVGALVVGFLVDRIGYYPFFLCSGLFISGALNTLLPFLSTFTQVTISRLIHVVGDSFFLVTFRLMILRLFPKEGLGGGVGLTQAIFTCGILAGSLLSGFFPSGSIPFIAAGMCSIASIPLISLLLKTPSASLPKEERF